MDWTELSVSSNTFGADLVSEALIRAGAEGTQILDRNDIPAQKALSASWELIDPALWSDLPEDAVVKAWFATGEAYQKALQELEFLKERMDGRAGTLTVSFATVREEDWAEYWKQYYKPLRIGRRLVVKPSWEEYTPQVGDLIIELDPGMAFGTGTHETTALCLELIEKHWRPGPMLDVGTGSGILAIAAALLGAERVLAIDLDPVAVRVARENIRSNGLEGIVEARRGDLLSGIKGLYSLATANILADAIIALASPLVQHLKPKSVFVCSGILREREADVRGALTTAGFRVIDAGRRGAWVALAAIADTVGSA